MEAWKNRPVITKQDHPAVVASALRESIPWYNRNLPGQAEAWSKTTTDSYESVESDFGADGDSTIHAPKDKGSVLYMSPAQLELALVIYGVKHISNAEKVAKVDDLLTGIDHLNQTSQQ